jgi:hypothetical protein
MGLPLPGKLRWIVPGILAAGVGSTLLMRRKEIKPPLVLNLAVTAVTGMALAVVAWQLGWRSMLERHALLILLPAYLSLYGIISLYADAPRRRVLVVWTMVVGLTTVVAFDAMLGHLAKSGDWKRVAAYIEANESPQQAILVFPAIAAIPFSYHYRGINEIVALPRPEEFLRYNYQEDSLQHEGEIVAALDLVPYPVESVWVIVNCNPHDCGYLNVSYNLHVLENYVAANYMIEETNDFFGVYVQRCTRPDRLAEDVEIVPGSALEHADVDPSN